ncbi:MAG: glycosyltransferase [Chloroflexota bacterium]|nr:glycosyltransferase [Chloroflexota bacterium]
MSSDVCAAGGSAPALSICIPTFNRPHLVKRTIRSVAESGAGHTDLVEIVVSDNSPDVSEAVCRRLLAGWAGRSLYLPNRPDIGAIANFNQCIVRSSGRFVLFVHDDDVLLPNAVRDILEAVTKADARPVLLFGVRVVDAMGRTMRWREVDAETDLSPEAALRRVLSDIEFVRIPAVVVRRDAYLEAGMFDERFSNATDLDMWVGLFSRHGVRCLPSTTSIYSVHADSATNEMSFDERAIGTLMEIFDVAKARRILPDRTIADCQREYFHQFILGAAYLRLRGGETEGARLVMRLFNLPSVRRLGWSPRWLPVRLVFEVIVRSPTRLIHPSIAWVERHDLVRRIRARSLKKPRPGAARKAGRRRSR